MNCLNFIPLADFEVYLKAKIGEVHQTQNDEGNSCISDPNELSKIMQLRAKLMKPSYHRGIDLISAHCSRTNESKASLYYTPNECVDQSYQLQSSPMHINFIQENLNTFTDCVKPDPICKFDLNMHGADGEQETDHTVLCANIEGRGEDDDDEKLDITTEQTQMLNSNKNDDGDDDLVNNLSQDYIPLNTLPKHNAFKRSGSGKDTYYSLENVFDTVSSKLVNNLTDMAVSNKTIDEATETQATSSTSDNSSSGNMSRSNAMTSGSLDENPSQSMLVLNEGANLEDVATSNSMPNITSKIEELSRERHDDEYIAASQFEQMLPN